MGRSTEKEEGGSKRTEGAENFSANSSLFCVNSPVDIWPVPNPLYFVSLLPVSATVSVL